MLLQHLFNVSVLTQCGNAMVDKQRIGMFGKHRPANGGVRFGLKEYIQISKHL